MKNWRKRKVAVADAISGRIRPGVGVQELELGHHLVGGQDADLDRQHQGDEDGPEGEHAAGEAEVDDGEGGEQRDRDFADGDAHGHDEGIEHHRCDGAAARALQAGAEDGRIVLDHALARESSGWARLSTSCGHWVEATKVT
jgi:hypothetical protein